MHAVDENRSNLLPCVVLDGVLCSYRKDMRVSVMSRCFKCRHFRRFEREMAEEDEDEARFVEEVWKHPDRYLRGELR
jgi:hypothetical protein